MKIGLITIQKSQLNYGACLQCFALFQRIKQDFGHCEVIDILRPLQPGYRRSSNFADEMSRRQMIGIYKYRFLTWLKKSKAEKERDRRFAEFCDMIDYTDCYHSLNELYNKPPKFDIYITGSDQVWSAALPFINEPYFLTFTKENERRISYASSFGTDKLQEQLKHKYAERLSRYENISVREDSGSEIIKNLIGIDVPVVMDPVFLLSKEEWRKQEKSVSGIEPKSYVFLYILHYDATALKKAGQYAKAKHKNLYYCLSELGKKESTYGTQIENAGPAEWLWLIDNAETVITMSFHGSAFATIFESPLLILEKKGVSTNTRIENITRKLGIENHVYDINTDEDLSPADLSFDTEKLREAITHEVKASLKYLSSAIHGIK